MFFCKTTFNQYVIYANDNNKPTSSKTPAFFNHGTGVPFILTSPLHATWLKLGGAVERLLFTHTHTHMFDCIVCKYIYYYYYYKLLLSSVCHQEELGYHQEKRALANIGRNSSQMQDSFFGNALVVSTWRVLDHRADSCVSISGEQVNSKFNGAKWKRYNTPRAK